MFHTDFKSSLPAPVPVLGLLWAGVGRGVSVPPSIHTASQPGAPFLTLAGGVWGGGEVGGVRDDLL